MKKIICILAALSAITIGAFAQENDSSKKRIDIVIADSICTNTASTANTTKLGLRFGFSDNNIGISAGGMVREAFCTANIDDGFPLDYYIAATPYIGIDIWNVDLIAGLDVLGDGNFSPYISLGYGWDLIEPSQESGSGLKLTLGTEYFIDQFTGTRGANKDADNAGIGAAAVDFLSIVIPKVSVGIQYTFGWGI